MNMKRFKLLAVAGAVLVILTVFAGCASIIVVGAVPDSVKGPMQLRQYSTINTRNYTYTAIMKNGDRKEQSPAGFGGTLDVSKVGVQTVSFAAGKDTISFQVEVMEYTGMKIVSQPPAWELGAWEFGMRSGGGGAFVHAAMPDPSNRKNWTHNWPGLEIHAEYDQMGSEKIDFEKLPIDEFEITGLDPEQAGMKTITVSWRGKQTTFSIEVVAMESIRIESNPAKLTYFRGEPLNTEGLQVIGKWPKLPEHSVSASSSGYNSGTLGRQTVTLTANGKTATFNVEVLPSPNGEWTRKDGQTVWEQRFEIGSKKWSYYTNNKLFMQGTFTLNGATVTTVMTTMLNVEENKMKTKQQMIDDIKEKGGDSVQSSLDILEALFSPTPWVFAVTDNGNQLVLTGTGQQPQTWAKK
ncbi:MAG: bacterial Ig-like domain-containing protein [Treponema sp.]|jgi:hypothetical protein|nr:bacterial Ig-like domain-containing protein [Treponema sp.]